MKYTFFYFIILFFFLSCAARVGKVENPIYKNACYDFTLPQGDWSEVSVSLLEYINETQTAGYICFKNPTIFAYSNGEERYEIVLLYVKGNKKWDTKEIARKELSTQLGAKYEKMSMRTGFTYKIEEFQDRERYCHKVYGESIEANLRSIQGDKRKEFKIFDLNPSAEYYQQAVEIKCLHPRYDKYKYIEIMQFKRISIDQKPKQNFEQEAMEFFNNLEFTLYVK